MILLKAGFILSIFIEYNYTKTREIVISAILLAEVMCMGKLPAIATFSVIKLSLRPVFLYICANQPEKCAVRM